jgi:hypothetical protein
MWILTRWCHSTAIKPEFDMNKTNTEKQVKRDVGAPEWIWEVLIFLTITPGVVYGLLSIDNLPIV